MNITKPSSLCPFDIKRPDRRGWLGIAAGHEHHPARLSKAGNRGVKIGLAECFPPEAHAIGAGCGNRRGQTSCATVNGDRQLTNPVKPRDGIGQVAVFNGLGRTDVVDPGCFQMSSSSSSPTPADSSSSSSSASSSYSSSYSSYSSSESSGSSSASASSAAASASSASSQASAE